MSEPQRLSKQNTKSRFCLKSLRLSLKYRPEILKLILKMRHRIRRRDSLLKLLKHRLKDLESTLAKEKNPKVPTIIDQKSDETSESASEETHSSNIKAKSYKDCSTQISSDVSTDNKITVKQDAGWSVPANGESEKSIAEQVKEAAQNVLQDRGMVYVESAGMYYDYKTGYYYNSELGLYYHSDTGCYYHYSDNQFVFHSYPDMSKVNSALIAHQKKKERKLKRERKPDDIENLTKHLSQDTEDAAKPKKIRKIKDKKIKPKKTKEGSKQTSNKGDTILNEVGEPKSDQNRDGGQNECDVHMKVNKNDEVTVEDGPETQIEYKDQNADDFAEKTEDFDVKEIKDDEKEELEDGECSDTDSEKAEESDAESESSKASTATVSDEESVARQHPPCMRVIVRETTVPKLKAGSLFLITKDGGSAGREGSQHAILLPDHNVSRNHLSIQYDASLRGYTATDLGSKNGSILNGTRMSESQQVSRPLPVVHGSTIQLGETKLLCHIHPGTATCGQCEPGLLLTVEEEKKVAYTRTVSVKKQHELELARLKNIYAPQFPAIEEKPYNDRAQARREAVGSTDHAEKTQATDLDTSIAADNKGFKLLQKMGWSEGEGLGKDSQGGREPVPLVSNEGKSGLGTVGALAAPSSTPSRAPRARANPLAAGALRLAARTNMLRPPAKAFQDDSDEEE